MFRSGYELLYTPVLPDKKRPTKTLIDVGGEMSGGVLGAAFAFLVLATIPGVANSVLILAGIAASMGATSFPPCRPISMGQMTISILKAPTSSRR